MRWFCGLFKHLAYIGSLLMAGYSIALAEPWFMWGFLIMAFVIDLKLKVVKDYD